jgi:hypothetical protein
MPGPCFCADTLVFLRCPYSSILDNISPCPLLCNVHFLQSIVVSLVGASVVSVVVRALVVRALVGV